MDISMEQEINEDIRIVKYDNILEYSTLPE